MIIVDNKSAEIVQGNDVVNTKKRKVWKEIYFFCLLTTVLILGLMTLSLAFYRQYSDPNSSINSNNTIKTGDIIFSYSDNSSEIGNPTNAIRIVNASSMPDTDGKTMLMAGSYFDFQIFANSTQRNLKYQILLEKINGSTIDEKNVKVYITELNNQNEIPILESLNNSLVKTYNQYENIMVNKVNNKLLIERDVTSDNYQVKYRLRFWINNVAENYHNQKFAAKININVAAK